MGAVAEGFEFAMIDTMAGLGMKRYSSLLKGQG